MSIVNVFAKLRIRGKIICTISTLILVTLIVVSLIVSIQSNKWFADEAREKLDVSVKILLENLNDRINTQIKSMGNLTKDDGIITQTTLVKDLLIESPDQHFDEAYIEMTRTLAINLKKTSEIEGYDLLKLYDYAGNLLAFYSRKEKLAGWLIGKNTFSGLENNAPVDGVKIPSTIERKIDKIPDKVLSEYNIYSSMVAINTSEPIFEIADDKKKLSGFVTINSLLDQDYAEKMSHLTNTKITFFTNNIYSAGMLKEFTKLDQNLYNQLVRKYTPGAKKKDLIIDKDIKVKGNSYFGKAYPFNNGSQVIGAMSVLYPKKQAKTKTRNAIMTLLLITIVASVIGIVIGFIVTGGIVNPIKNIITKLRAAANKVSTATSDTLKVSQSVADASATMASSLEETSSSVQEMTSMVQKNADNAGQASKMMKDTGGIVVEANAVMSSMQTAMNDIKTNSDRISKIIKVIEEISFQTNLLALNAAVEAARAGEHGKGFAVVAEEVRSLAQRAAASARDTGGLIDKAVKSVDGGISKVDDVAEGLAKVGDSASKVSSLVEEIANASNEQAQGINQINSTIAEMNKVTQKVASDTDKSARASEEMSAQAVEMRGNVQDLVSLVENQEE